MLPSFPDFHPAPFPMRPDTLAAPPPAAPAPEPTARFLRACRRLETDATPVWMMRQAGRYMAEYRALRERHSMLEVVQTPELAAEVTLQPLRTFDFDAGIIFADLLPPLVGMGLSLDYEKGHGPVIHNPIRSTKDVDLLGTPPAEELPLLAGTLEAIRLVKRETDRPLIGFAGAPWTLVGYAIEGGGSKNYERTKALMYGEPAAWKRLMEKLVTVSADFLLAQARAGADALQVFDSWAGALGPADYVRFVQPHMRALFARLAPAGVPLVNFSTGTAGYLEEVAAAGGDVIGVDWRQPLDRAWARVGHDRAVMGNLDPVVLQAPWRELRPAVDDVLDRAAGRPGHVFNLGHGILPATPVDAVRRVVDYVHERTAR